uniref:JmjC domain-containing protein n=2 Tax=Mesocestoides corti TaxID=53468 RepID=A0A5K3EXQ7_MESCO
MLSQDVRAQKSMSFKKFEKMSNSARLQTPTHNSMNDLEEIYWNSIGNLQPIYGANVSGSLTDPDQPSCNIPKLRSTLSDILAQEDIEIGGVNTPYLYFGAWATTFAWHVEDMDLYSINYLHFGSPKLWYCIPPAFARKFEAFARACHSFLRHKSILINPRVLAAAGIPTRRILQHEGEIMCTFPYGYHAGFNTGVNCAESTNFALPRWVDYGKHATICKCWDDTVRIEMSPFVRRVQPHLFDVWQCGLDKSPHPLDIYKPRMREVATLVDALINSEDRTASSILSPEDSVMVSLGKRIADLNVQGLFYAHGDLAKATLPSYLRRNRKLQALWCGFKKDFRAIVHFNTLIGTLEPFCSICAFFWPPLVARKALTESHKGETLPEFSEPYLSEVAFCRSPSDFPHICLNGDPASRVYQCCRCKVVVHARCYGIDEARESNRFSWVCDACKSDDEEQQCVLCPIRGGALKPLANPCNSNDHKQFWVHLACAIAVGSQQCCFVDVRLREPLLLVSRRSKSTSKRSFESSSSTQNASQRTGLPLKPPTQCPETRRRSIRNRANKPEVRDAPLTTINLASPEKHLSLKSPEHSSIRSKAKLAPSHVSLPPRDGKPAKLAKAHGLGTPRLTISGRLGSPTWWNSSLSCAGSSTPPIRSNSEFDDEEWELDNAGKHSRLSSNASRKDESWNESNSALQESFILTPPAFKEDNGVNVAASTSTADSAGTTTAPSDAFYEDEGSSKACSDVIAVVEVSDSDDSCQFVLESRHRSQRRARPPAWTTRDYLVTRPRKISKQCRKLSNTSLSPTKNAPSTSTAIHSIECGRQPSLKANVSDHCDECGLPSPGGPNLNLPLVHCWHNNCPGRIHLTCAQLGGVLIATGRYPHCFYVACRRHLSEYRQYEQVDEEVPLEPGDPVYALYPGNGRYYNAVAVELAAPRVCKVVFQDGTFSRDTPSDCIIGHDWRSLGSPKVGSQVKVKWKDGVEYPAVFEGASVDKWSVRFQNGQTVRLRRDKIFRVNERIPTHIRRLIMR